MTPDRIGVRDAVDTDAPAISPLLSELGYPTTVEEVLLRLRMLRKLNQKAVLVAQKGERVVGVVTVHAALVLHRPKPIGRVTALVVAEEERGQGIGRALVAAAEARMRTWGCGRIELTSGKQRTDAHAFYRKLGYVERSVRFVKD